MNRILGYIAVLAEQVTPGSLVKLGKQPRGKESQGIELTGTKADVRIMLRPLSAVLDVPTEPGFPMRLIHPSFRDFLLNPDRRGPLFNIQGNATHELLFNRSLDLMRRHLRKNICMLRQPDELTSGIDELRLRSCLPPKYSMRVVTGLRICRKTRPCYPKTEPSLSSCSRTSSTGLKVWVFWARFRTDSGILGCFELLFRYVADLCHRILTWY